MSFWGPEGHAARLHHLRAWHRSQPGENFSHHKDGPDSEYKGFQRVTGCLTALSRFILRLGERGLPLYRLLKKADHFEWMPEAQEALDKVKQLLMKAPILVPQTDGEPLLLYIASTTKVVSAALVVEREEEGHALKV